MAQKSVIVIGAGFSGLAAATCLARDGFEVTILEKNAIPGGRARYYSEAGFTFDLGPSWYWLPDVFERYFAQFGKKPSDYYELVRLDPSYLVFYGKDNIVPVPAGMENVCQTFEKIEKGAASQLRKFLKAAEYKYNIGINDLVYKPGLSPLEYIRPDVLTAFFRLNIFTSFHKYIRKYFKDKRLFPILNFPIIFLGSTPYRTPALYSLMNYADMGLGTWYPLGGMFKVVEAMVSLAKDMGVQIHLNEPVEHIEVVSQNASGVRTNKNFYPADVIISSADYHHTEQNLLEQGMQSYSEKYWDKREMAPSSLLFYLGLDCKIDGIEHHNLLFDEDFDRHARELFEEPQWPTKPLLYVSATSKTDPGVAPEGCENVVILIPVAPGLYDSEQVRENYYKLAITRLEKITGQSLAQHVIYKKTYAHNDFITDYNAYKGNAYGLGNTLLQTAFLKPKIRSKKVKNLFYCGQLTTPGPGVPPGLISGQVVARQVFNSF